MRQQRQLSPKWILSQFRMLRVLVETNHRTEHRHMKILGRTISSIINDTKIGRRRRLAVTTVFAAITGMMITTLLLPTSTSVSTQSQEEAGNESNDGCSHHDSPTFSVAATKTTKSSWVHNCWVRKLYWNVHPGHQQLLCTSPLPPVGDEHQSPPDTAGVTNDDVPAHTYDFLVIGYGIVGRSAVTTLRQQCPNATIAVIDPFVRTPNDIDHLPGCLDLYHSSRATNLDPITKECRVISRNSKNDTSLSVQEHRLYYRHAILIATGSRGAPPPPYLLDEKAQSRIYELRATIVPSMESSEECLVVDKRGDSDTDENRVDTPKNEYTTPYRRRQSMKSQRPILSPENVRRRVAQQANQGSTIVVLGSGWDAIDLVVSASASSKSTSSTGRPTIVFGNHGPLCHMLPNYLSTAVAKRLQAKRINVLDRSLVRYVAYVDDRNMNHSQQGQHRLRVYTAKSFDFLDGQCIQADYLVIAPETQGSRGTGALPTPHIPSFLQNSARDRTSWYHTWSRLAISEADDPTLLACYKDDGRIVVNNELCACRGVYAAGSVAKCPNGRTGNATVTGCGIVDGADTGYTAAMNMSRCLEQNDLNLAYLCGSIPIATKDPIPLWRSDIRSTAQDFTSVAELSSLEDIGIKVLCVGNCDSESLATHGVWWTNQAAQRRLLAISTTKDNHSDTDTVLRKKGKQTIKPVYGLGVVYYLDRTGKIQGVMTWGLPFYHNNDHRPLNQLLVDQMKNVVKTNGGFRSIETEQDRIEFSKYLGDTSKQMIATAFSIDNSNIGNDRLFNRALDCFPRPLFRYTENRLPNVRGVGVVKRNDGHGQGVLGQDLFARFDNDDLPDHPVPLPLVGNLGSAIAKVKAQYEREVWEQIERRWDENEARARPPKEDPLWIRKGDEFRNLSERERLDAAYRSVRYGP